MASGCGFCGALLGDPAGWTVFPLWTVVTVQRRWIPCSNYVACPDCSSLIVQRRAGDLFARAEPGIAGDSDGPAVLLAMIDNFGEPESLVDFARRQSEE